ncbi:MAG: hypothetical protein K0U54_03545 [Bacteroidetes bacterium]|nr:hypothetical protein [Bacteroidota bacterium]
MNNISAKTLAIIAYITFIGAIIAYFLNKENKHEFATWHIKNMFGLIILYFISFALSTQELLWEVGAVFFYTSAIAWLVSMVFAILNKKVGIPFLSEKFQTWFRFLD